MIDYSRHEDVFHPVKFGDRRVDVIGVGATGSKVALSLAKLGVKNLHVWDDDKIEEHNVANQVYGNEEVGQSKTAAIIRRAGEDTGAVLTEHGWWDGDTDLGEIIFMMADSMKVRKQFFEAVKWNPHVRLVIDSRMGAESAQLYSYTPGNSASLRGYEGTLFDDADAVEEVSACGTRITVGPTGDIISGLAVWTFIRHVAGDKLLPAIALGTRDPMLVVMD